MDRRQRKTREAIFAAFSELLHNKDFTKITVGDIIDLADVGRATFYSHFETKEYLLKAFCEDLFCHIFDSTHDCGAEHRHIFDCDGGGSVFLHLLRHLYRNDNNILALLSSRNNGLFLKYFGDGLEALIDTDCEIFQMRDYGALPESFVKGHIVSTFTETVKWWTDNGMKLPPEVVAEYFFTVV